MGLYRGNIRNMGNKMEAWCILFVPPMSVVLARAWAEEAAVATASWGPG